ERWGTAMWRGFLQTPREGWAEFAAPEFDLNRTFDGFDGDRVVGTLRSFASELTVPGGAIVPSAALTNVTVAPTHRRQGLLGRMPVSSSATSAGGTWPCRSSCRRATSRGPAT